MVAPRPLLFLADRPDFLLCVVQQINRGSHFEPDPPVGRSSFVLFRVFSRECQIVTLTSSKCEESSRSFTSTLLTQNNTFALWRLLAQLVHRRISPNTCRSASQSAMFSSSVLSSPSFLLPRSSSRAMPGVLRFVPCLRPWTSAFVAEPRFHPFVVGQAISKRDGRGSTDAGNPLRGLSPAKLPHSRVCRPWVDVTQLRSPHCPHIFAAHTAHVAAVLELGARLCGGELQHTLNVTFSECWRRATCSTMYTLTSSYDTECDNWVKLEYWKNVPSAFSFCHTSELGLCMERCFHPDCSPIPSPDTREGAFPKPLTNMRVGLFGPSYMEGRLPEIIDKHVVFWWIGGRMTGWRRGEDGRAGNGTPYTSIKCCACVSS